MACLWKCHTRNNKRMKYTRFPFSFLQKLLVMKIQMIPLPSPKGYVQNSKLNYWFLLHSHWNYPTKCKFIRTLKFHKHAISEIKIESRNSSYRNSIASHVTVHTLRISERNIRRCSPVSLDHSQWFQHGRFSIHQHMNNLFLNRSIVTVKHKIWA